MRLWIITQYFHPENFGINQVAADLASRGHSVTVLTGMPNYPSGTYWPDYGGWRIRRESYDGVAVIRVPELARGSATPGRLALNYLSYAIIASITAPFLLRGRPDVVFVYQPSPLSVAFPAIVVRWLKRTRLVLWVQDLWPELLMASDIKVWPIALRLVRAVARFVYRRCSLILVQSPAYIGPIRALAPNVVVQYFPNSVDSQFHPLDPAPQTEEQLGLPRGFRVLFAGNIGIVQDFETILAAAEQLRDVAEIQWVVIGEGRRKSWLGSEIVARNLTQSVHLIDQQEADRIPVYFASAQALLATLSRSEVAGLTIPTKLQAYLACGRPIIAAIEGEGARIVAASGAGLTCEPGRPAALAAAVLALFRMSAADRDTMGKAGRRYFEQEFEGRMLMDRLDGWLQEVSRAKS